MDRDFILSEIKRTTRSNGGTPLGRRRFSNETGIKDSDWLGRYWSKWGDALREAGFEPNRKTPRLADEAVFESLVKFVAELGHFPTNAELRIRARNEAGFPSHSKLDSLGSKQQLAAALANFCADRPELQAVAATPGHRPRASTINKLCAQPVRSSGPCIS